MLKRLAKLKALPAVITVNNEREFADKVLNEWANRQGVKLNFIRPSKPIESAYIESINSKIWMNIQGDVQRYCLIARSTHKKEVGLPAYTMISLT